MNNYFSNIATELDGNLPSISSSPLNYVNSNNTSSFYLFETCKIEISNLISKLKKTSCDINHIPVPLFKLLSEYLSYPISKLINS